MRFGILNVKGLAEKLGVSQGYVYAMKSAGFKFTDGRGTTFQSAVDWLLENPNFSSAPRRKVEKGVLV